MCFIPSHLDANPDRNRGFAEIVCRFGSIFFAPSAEGLISDLKRWRERMEECAAKNDMKAAELKVRNSVTESVWRSGNNRLRRV
jgi:hypothetical protein